MGGRWRGRVYTGYLLVLAWFTKKNPRIACGPGWFKRRKIGSRTCLCSTSLSNSCLRSAEKERHRKRPIAATAHAAMAFRWMEWKSEELV